MTWTSIIFYGWTCACAGYAIGWFNGYFANTEGSHHG